MIDPSATANVQIITGENHLQQGAELAAWLRQVPGIPAENTLPGSQVRFDGRIIQLGNSIDLSTDKNDASHSIQLDSDWRNLEQVACLFEHLSGRDKDWSFGQVQDIFVSAGFGDVQLLRRIADHPQVRLVGVSPTQLGIYPENRLASMLESCSAYLTMLPNRANYAALERISQELALARSARIPALVLGEDIAALSPDAQNEIIWGDLAAIQATPFLLEELLHEVFANWQPARKPHYAFYATTMSLDYTQRNQAVRRVMEAALQMPCVLGSEIRGGHVQQQIIELLRQARLVVANTSDGNQNILIESGITLGAKRDLYLLSSQSDRQYPFMLADQQFWHYGDEIDLLGLVYKIALPYRRKVLRVPEN